MTENVGAQNFTVTREAKEKQKGHKSCTLWLTGLSGAGKTTLANAIEKRLHKRNIHTHILDGDDIRHGLSGDLGFSDEDRVENIRRIGEVSKLFVDAGIVTLSAFISPFAQDRKIVRELHNSDDFIEVHVDCPLEICEQRDVKGLYKKAREGIIKNFTGIDSPYETPKTPEITVNTHQQNLDECVDTIISYLDINGYVK